MVGTLDALQAGLDDAGEMLDLAIEESDEETVEAVAADLQPMPATDERLDFEPLFAAQLDHPPCFLDIPPERAYEIARTEYLFVD